jgi:hypothetical protein
MVQPCQGGGNEEEEKGTRDSSEYGWLMPGTARINSRYLIEQKYIDKLNDPSYLLLHGALYPH